MTRPIHVRAVAPTRLGLAVLLRLRDGAHLPRRGKMRPIAVTAAGLAAIAEFELHNLSRGGERYPSADL